MKARKIFLFVFTIFVLSLTVPVSIVMAADEADWRDEQIYLIMVDRFNNGDSSNDYDTDISDPEAYHGGDIQGIIDQLDELKERGFTAIRLTPIMKNADNGYHGYWVEDFMAVEEHFGTIEDARQLVNEAHQRDIKVIFDFVVNHTAPDHPWLKEEEKEDWFHEEQALITGDEQAQIETAWISGLPDLNHSNPEVRDYLFDVAEFWIKETGVDGFHFDSVKHVPEEFWNDFNQHIKNLDPEIYLSAEVWNDDPGYIAGYQDAGFDSFIDYPFYETATNVFASPGQSLEPLYNLWEYNRGVYESPHLLGLFMDNHDTKRFTRVATENDQNPITRWKLAYTYLYTAPGLPVVYQGSEVPMDGGEVPDNRNMVAFNSGDEELRNHLETLSSIRQQYPALTAGDFEMIASENAMSLFKRSYEGESVYIAINNGTDTTTLPITDLEEGQQLRGLLMDNTVRQQDDGTWRIVLDRETSDVFIVEANTGINWWFVSFIALVMSGFIISVIYLSWKSRTQSKKTN